MAELKPCPFCGSEAKVTFVLGKQAVVCQGCNAEMVSTYSPIEVLVEMWNKRADVQPVNKFMSDVCMVCGRDVRKDNTYYDINGATVCEGCMSVSCKVEMEG